MIIFTSITISSLSVTALTVEWTIADTTEDLSQIHFTVFRSNSPEGPFDEISRPLFNQFIFVDTDVNLFSKHRIYFFKVRATDVGTGSILESDVAVLEDRPDKIGEEIRRRNTLLMRRFVGVPVFVFIQRSFGQRCPSCWDHIKRRERDSQCRTCFTTGFVGGYHNQINTIINLDPDPKITGITALGELHEQETNAWTIHFPIYSPRDVIVEKGSNRRWRVVSVQTTRKFNAVMHQVFRLRQINKADIEYDIPVIDSDILQDLEKKFRNTHTLVEIPTLPKEKVVQV